MTTNNTLQSLIKNERFQLPPEYLSTRATTKRKGIYQKLNINIDSLVAPYYPVYRFIRVGEDESFDEKYAKNKFIPYLKILDIIKKNDLTTCLHLNCNEGHLVYLARLMEIDCFGFNNVVRQNEKQIFVDKFKTDCLIEFDMNNLHRLNHFFDVIILMTSNYDEMSFKQILKTMSNIANYVVINVSKSNIPFLEKYAFIKKIDKFSINGKDEVLLLQFTSKIKLDQMFKYVLNKENNLINLIKK